VAAVEEAEAAASEASTVIGTTEDLGGAAQAMLGTLSSSREGVTGVRMAHKAAAWALLALAQAGGLREGPQGDQQVTGILT
jgi:hypothetical protein